MSRILLPFHCFWVKVIPHPFLRYLHIFRIVSLCKCHMLQNLFNVFFPIFNITYDGVDIWEGWLIYRKIYSPFVLSYLNLLPLSDRFYWSCSYIYLYCLPIILWLTLFALVSVLHVGQGKHTGTIKRNGRLWYKQKVIESYNACSLLDKKGCKRSPELTEVAITRV